MNEGYLEEKETPIDEILGGLRLLITAGPTEEPIDPVRYISNRSSGKMGYALAERAAFRGAEVCLVSGPVALEPPPRVEVVKVVTASEMFDEVMSRSAHSDVVIMAAAVADYRLKNPSSQKLKRGGENLLLELVPNPDILATLGRSRTGLFPFIVGFALETDHLILSARDKLERKGCDLLVANLASQSIGHDRSTAYLIDRDGVVDAPGDLPKLELADRILDCVAARVALRGPR